MFDWSKFSKLFNNWDGYPPSDYKNNLPTWSQSVTLKTVKKAMKSRAVKNWRITKMRAKSLKNNGVQRY